ncbi:MAG: hypothetical protein Q4B86_03875 [Eubacteriales bacterium]|nr:hypothetical protein [Eubacteriales bacterium]
MGEKRVKRYKRAIAEAWFVPVKDYISWDRYKTCLKNKLLYQNALI